MKKLIVALVLALSCPLAATQAFAVVVPGGDQSGRLSANAALQAYLDANPGATVQDATQALLDANQDEDMQVAIIAAGAAKASNLDESFNVTSLRTLPGVKTSYQAVIQAQVSSGQLNTYQANVNTGGGGGTGEATTPNS